MIRGRALVVVAIALAASGCAGPRYYDGGLPDAPGQSQVLKSGQARVWCAPYAREHSQVKIFGDAHTWWDQAAGKFQRDSLPGEGAVMVLADYAGPERGHLAVVKKLVSAREIRVDHANWLNDGSIYVNDPVADVSSANDWSAIKVWNMKTGAWGVRVYSVKGFIGPGRSAPAQAQASRERVALADQDSFLSE